MARFSPSSSGIGQMMHLPGVVAELADQATKIRVRAEATAPVETGDYKRSFGTDMGTKTIRGKKRPAAIVFNTSKHARWVEYGGRNTPRHATLRRAAHDGLIT